MAAEEKARAAAARSRRLQMVGGAVLVAALVVVAVILLAGGGGNDDKSSSTEKLANVKIPPAGPNAAAGKLAVAAKDAGCVNKTYGAEGREHTTSTVKYLTNPPTSGNHNPNPAEDGVY